MQICVEEMSPIFKINEKHSSACWLLHENSPAVEGYEKGVLDENGK
jgi:hypothetical protein